MSDFYLKVFIFFMLSSQVNMYNVERSIKNETMKILISDGTIYEGHFKYFSDYYEI